MTVNLAPALTWLHLFPADTALQGSNVPEWFGRLLDGRTSGGRRTRVLFDAAPVDIANAAKHDGIVAVNGQGLTAEVFAQQGYQYIRHFAAVPNLAEARWFIPLDTHSVTAAGFDLFSPAKRTARLKLSAVRMAARLGIGGWYRDSLWVAARERPPLEQMLGRVLPNTDFRLALSAGAPEPARNRKASAAVIDVNGRTRAFVKLPTSALADTLVRREATALSNLSEHFAARPGLVPGLLFAGDCDHRYALVQAPLGGKPTVPRVTPSHEQFLEALTAPSERRIAAKSPFFQQLIARVGVFAQSVPEIQRALAEITPILMKADVPRTIIHGDFAPWNIRRSRGTDCISVFDWEYGVIDGLPLIDRTHFLVQVGYLLANWSPEKALRELNSFAQHDTTYSQPITRALQWVYLVDSITRLLEEGYPLADEMVVWYRRLLELAMSGVVREN